MAREMVDAIGDVGKPVLKSYIGHGMIERYPLSSTIGGVALHELRHKYEMLSEAQAVGADVDVNIDIHIEFIDGRPVAVAGETRGVFRREQEPSPQPQAKGGPATEPQARVSAPPHHLEGRRANLEARRAEVDSQIAEIQRELRRSRSAGDPLPRMIVLRNGKHITDGEAEMRRLKLLAARIEAALRRIEEAEARAQSGNESVPNPPPGPAEVGMIKGARPAGSVIDVFV
ncbi:MAG: hypothetical protein ACUVXI_07110 [bacterium]